MDLKATEHAVRFVPDPVLGFSPGIMVRIRLYEQNVTVQAKHSELVEGCDFETGTHFNRFGVLRNYNEFFKVRWGSCHKNNLA
jgi:hypothetical protein